MKWSFPLARVAGIDIKVHASFFLILGFAGLQWGAPHGAAGAAFGVLLMALLFACVVLHELGHSLVARAFGIPVREIVLLPIGGVALMQKNPERPLHELLIAIAGPLVNVAISLGLWVAVSRAFPEGLDPKVLGAAAGAAPSAVTLLLWLFVANVSLALFNMIPAFPLDGGRVLRAILAMGMGFSKATRVASTIGQAIAVGLGLFAVLNGQLFLAFVAFFIFLGAGSEKAEEGARTVLKTLRVGDAYNKHALTLAPGDHVSKVVDYILTSYQPDFAVLQGSALLGVVTRQDVLTTLATQPQDLYVAGVMNREVTHVDAGESLDGVRRTMGEREVRVVAVYDGERYLGLVSAEDLGEALLVATFMKRHEELSRAAAAA